MKKPTSILQKIATIFGVLSFISAVICAFFLYFQLDDSGPNNPVSASLLASIFFFIFVGFVLLVVGKTNLPSFKPGDYDSTNE
ncbi:MAG: hypothetical protein OQL09_06160 [Gammaproteobacteria bacterium]|nr:hypothetical protein [Gammaproteobacteria bacterium]